MMDLARATLVAAGRDVIGGYLSPSHDSYVSTKDAGRAARPAEDRVLLCEEAVADHDWLMVDPWEARAVGVAINYTDVLRRLEAYLAVHVPGAAPEVAYVFGGDNAGFARAFLDHGTCVCVPRPGCEDQVRRVAAEPEIAGCDRIHVAARPTSAGASPERSAPVSISSSAIRTGGQAHVPAGVAALLDRWDANPSPAAAVLAVRNDVDWAIAPWRRVPAAAPPAAVEVWREEVVDALHEAFSGTGVLIECYDLDAQAEHVAALAASGPVLVLDPCTSAGGPPTRCRLAPTRLFAVSDGQRRAIDTVARPGQPALRAQVASIAPGDYTLVDDDVSTGTTLATIRALLPPSVRITEVVSLLDWSRAQAGATGALHDCADLRDLLVGARDAGLVVELPDRTIGRVPYVLPYVSPASRLSMPPAAAVPFSQRVWQANARFFRAWPVPPCAADSDPATRALWSAIGVDDRTPLADVCAWHATRLSELPFSRTPSPDPRR